MSQLKAAIEKVKSTEDSDLNDAVLAAAKKESKRSVDDIYSEVVIDEVNNELLKAIQKADGDTVMVLLRQERLGSFEKLWRQTNLDYYQTKENKALSDRLRQKSKA